MENPIAVSSCVITLRLKLSSSYLAVLSAYAPTLVAFSEEKDAFCNQLSKSIRLIWQGDCLALAGDFNARVGSDCTSWSGALGAHRVGNLNENGQHLLELFSAFHLCLADTYFAGSMSSKVTWMHPHSRWWHQLDHMIVRRRQLNKVRQCILRTVTDHALVRCKLALGARKFHLSHSRPSPSIDCSATKDPVKIKRFQTLFCNHLNSSSPAPKDHEDAWAEFCTAVTDSDVIAFGRPSRKQPDWFCDSADLLLPALEAKHKARAMVCTHDTRNARLHLTSCKT